MQPQEFTLGEPLTVMRFYSVSFDGTGMDSSRLRDFSHNAGKEREKREEESIATHTHPPCIVQSSTKLWTDLQKFSAARICFRAENACTPDYL